MQGKMPGSEGPSGDESSAGLQNIVLMQEKLALTLSGLNGRMTFLPAFGSHNVFGLFLA